MKKTTDSELNKWRFQYPSAIVSRRAIGDRDYARFFIGQGNLLLYQVKNMMKFNKLGQLKMTRLFTDGTVITASSVFGRDQVIIDVSKSTMVGLGIKPSCTITLINVPSIVQPMRYPDGIGQDEIEGIDYIKTYYTFDVSKCNQCNEPSFNVCDVDELFTLIRSCDVFYFTNPNVPSREDDPDNHAIYSIPNFCMAEIISFGEDGGGKYFLWKAYTEWPADADFSRSGLGYMLLRTFIKLGLNELCQSGPFIIKVDCCHKDSTEREVVMLAERTTVNEWKEDCADRGDCESYGDCEETWDWCPVPPEIPFDALLEETSFRARPEEQVLGEGETKPPGDGSCLPYVWEFITSENIGNIEPSGDFNESMIYTPPDTINCHDDITITVKDRCETSYQIHRPPCCDVADPLVIGYTSLAMTFNQTQTLTASGGCKPYTWSLVSGPGTLVPNEDNTEAIYTAPGSNPTCAKAVIKLEDCCNLSTTIEIRISSSSTYSIWVWVFSWSHQCGTHCWPWGYFGASVMIWDVYKQVRNCLTGELISETYETTFSIIGEPPTSSSEVFCAEEGTGSVCYTCPGTSCNGYLSFTTPYCNGCKSTPGGCCPPD